jgi:hypothetical protein
MKMEQLVRPAINDMLAEVAARVVAKKTKSFINQVKSLFGLCHGTM